MAHWFATALRMSALRRRAELDERSAVLTLFARFADEVGSGLLVVLMPTLRARLGLSVAQVGWCFQAMSAAGALVEPTTGVAVDLVRRRPLLVVGASAWAAALLVAAGAPSFGWLLLAFALAGAAYGPLTTTADVVLVEGHPNDVERIAGRSTAIDTVGALLAPLAVAAAGWMHLDDRWLLAAAGIGTCIYASLLATARFPAPTQPASPPAPTQPASPPAPTQPASPPAPTQPGASAARTTLATVAANVRVVVADRRARPWLLALVLLETLDLPEMFEPVWLRDVVGASQPLVAVHVATGLAASLVALVVLDRWLARHDALPVLIGCGLAALVIYPAWLFAPGMGAKLLLVIPRQAATAPLWPILRSRALAAVPDRPGTVAAVTSLVSILPLAAAFGAVADRVGLTPVMLTVQVLGVVAVLGVLPRRTPTDEA